MEQLCFPMPECELCAGYLARANLDSVSEIDQRRLFRIYLDRFVGQELVLREDDVIDGSTCRSRTGVLSSISPGPDTDPCPMDNYGLLSTLEVALGSETVRVWADGLSWYTGAAMYAIGPAGCDLDDCEDYAEWLWEEAKVYIGPPYCVNCHKYVWEWLEPTVEILQ